MKIDLVILQFAIIFLPGLIWTGLGARYARKSKPSEFEYIVQVCKKKGRAMAQDGCGKIKPLAEGYIRKGGSNSATSQIQTRPPAPASMKPNVLRGAGSASPGQSGRTK